MPRKGSPIRNRGKKAFAGISQVSPYILVFLVLLVGGASVVSFIGLIIAAFTTPLLCLPLSGTFALTLRIAYGIIKMLLPSGG